MESPSPSPKTPALYKNNKHIAEESFIGRDYQKALFYYSLASQESPKDQEIKVGILLCDLASDMENEAQALYDYYQIARAENKDEASRLIETLVNSIDGAVSSVSQMLIPQKIFNIDEQKAISYSDFLLSVHDRGSFKKAFEDIMFSTKVVIAEKAEFLDFLENLVSSGYNDIALQYLESAAALFPLSEKVKELSGKIAARQKATKQIESKS